MKDKMDTRTKKAPKDIWKLLGVVLSIIFSSISLFYAYQANIIQTNIYPSQIKPLVQAKPVDFKISYYGNELMGETFIQIVNYSGFTAKNIRTDIKYSGSWIREWTIAATHGLSEKARNKPLDERTKKELDGYINTVNMNIGDLKPQSKNSLMQVWTGSWGTRESFDSLKNKVVSVRTRWMNELGFEEENISHYELVITKAYEKEVFTFIPLEKCN